MNRGASRLALGTVQLGLPYGAFNEFGQVAEGEAALILQQAAAAGVNMLDTAHGYGSSEQVLGGLGVADRFRIVTKVPALGSRPAGEISALVAESLQRLQTRSLHGLMMHSAADLLGDQGYAAWAALERTKADGVADRIGVSVYSPAEADEVLSRYPVEIMQLPFNVFDQRLLSCGTLERLKEAGVEVHVRSVFLQGFLLADPDRLSGHLGTFAGELRAFRDSAARAELSPLALALGFVLAEPRIDRVVVGVQSAGELEEILAACGTERELPDLSPLASDRLELIEPSRWPRSEQ